MLGAVRARHGRSREPESRRAVAAAEAVGGALAAQRLEASPTAVFAALMALLEPRAGSAEEDAAVLVVLAAALERCAPAALAGKVERAAGVIGACLEAHASHPPAAKGALECLALIIAAGAPRAKWHPGVGPGFALLLRSCADPRPKVRKRAQRGLGEVLEALAGASGVGATNLERASDTVFSGCKEVMMAPALLATKASEAKGKKARAEVQEALQKSLTETLHLLGALKQWLVLVAETQVVPIAQLVLDLMKLEQPLLARHASDVLFNLFVRRGGGGWSPALWGCCWPKSSACSRAGTRGTLTPSHLFSTWLRAG